MTRILIILCLFTLTLSNLNAKTFIVNPAHSSLEFMVPYMGISEVGGRFKSFKGKFEYQNGLLSSVDFRVLAASVDTADKKRDQHLRGKDFFEVRKYPNLSFESTSFDSAGKWVEGKLSIHGVTRKVRFSLKVKGLVKDPWDEKKESFYLSANTQINRKDYNLVWNKKMDKGGWVVGDKIDLKITVEAQPSDGKTAYSRFFVPTEKNSPEKSVKLIDSSYTSFSNNKDEKKTKELAEPANVKKGIFTVVIGFIVFLTMILCCWFLKKKLLLFFEKHMSEGKAEALSDGFLYSFLVVAAYLTAPFMGYGENPLLKLFQ